MGEVVEKEVFLYVVGVVVFGVWWSCGGVLGSFLGVWFLEFLFLVLRY